MKQIQVFAHFSVGARYLFVSFIFNFMGDKRMTNSFQLQIALLTLLPSIKSDDSVTFGSRAGKKDWLLE